MAWVSVAAGLTHAGSLLGSCRVSAPGIIRVLLHLRSTLGCWPPPPQAPETARATSRDGCVETELCDVANAYLYSTNFQTRKARPCQLPSVQSPADVLTAWINLASGILRSGILDAGEANHFASKDQWRSLTRILGCLHTHGTVPLRGHVFPSPFGLVCGY